MRAATRMMKPSWDKTNRRAVINHRFPKDTVSITGGWYRYRFSKTLTLAQADRLTHIQTTEYDRLVSEARERLGTPSHRLDIVRAKMAAKGAELAARKESLDALESVWRQKSEDVQFHIAARKRGIGPAPAANKPVDSDTLINAWQAERVAEKNPPKPKGIAAKRRVLADMLARTGREHLGAITLNDLMAYRLSLLNEGGSKLYDYLVELKPLFQTAKRNGMISTNPMLEIELPKKVRGKRDPFNHTEAKVILLAARSAEPVVRWAHWLAAFTTTINSELLEAHASEFYRNKTGQWVFDLRGRKLKTGFRPRVIPLHPSIIREGFLDYLATRTGLPLFPGKTGRNSNRLNDFVHSLGITKSFYSWRHMTVHALDQITTPSLARFIAGHAGSDIHEKHYHHHDMPSEFPKIVAAIEALPDPTL